MKIQLTDYIQDPTVAEVREIVYNQNREILFRFYESNRSVYEENVDYYYAHSSESERIALKEHYVKELSEDGVYTFSIDGKSLVRGIVKLIIDLAKRGHKFDQLIHPSDLLLDMGNMTLELMGPVQEPREENDNWRTLARTELRNFIERHILQWCNLSEPYSLDIDDFLRTVDDIGHGLDNELRNHPAIMNNNHKKLYIWDLQRQFAKKHEILKLTSQRVEHHFDFRLYIRRSGVLFERLKLRGLEKVVVEYNDRDHNFKELQLITRFLKYCFAYSDLVTDDEGMYQEVYRAIPFIFVWIHRILVDSEIHTKCFDY